MKLKTSAASSSQYTAPSSSSSAAQFYSAAPTASQAASTSQEPASIQAPSPSSAISSSQPTPSTSNQSTNCQGDNSWQGDQPYSMSYAQPIVDAHNTHRANHSVSSLKWNRTMEDTAKQIADTCIYAHSKAAGDGYYGQNIGAGFAPKNIGAMITNSMYNGEIDLYPGPYGSEPDGSNLEAWGHYSQIVWAGTQQVGCYTTDCSVQGLANVASGVGQHFTVCNYYPPGNWGGEFGANVLRPGNMRTVTIAQT